MNAPPVFAPGGNSPVVMYLRHSMIVWISVSCGERVGTVLPEPLWPTIRVSGGRNLCKKWCWRRDTLWFLAGLGQMSVFRESQVCWWSPWLWQCTSRVVDSFVGRDADRRSRILFTQNMRASLSAGERLCYQMATENAKLSYKGDFTLQSQTQNWPKIATSIFYLKFYCHLNSLLWVVKQCSEFYLCPISHSFCRRWRISVD